MRNILLSLLLMTAAARLNAQWRIATLLGGATSHGDARNDAVPDRPEFHADRPATFTLSVAREHGRARFSLEGRHITADLIEEGATVAVTTFGVFEAWGAGAEVSVRLAGRNDRATLRAGAGGGFDRWKLEGAVARWRPSARGSLETDLPLARGLSVVIRGEATVGPSMFVAEELPDGFTLRTDWRTGISLGVAKSFRATRP